MLRRYVALLHISNYANQKNFGAFAMSANASKLLSFSISQVLLSALDQYLSISSSSALSLISGCIMVRYPSSISVALGKWTRLKSALSPVFLVDPRTRVGGGKTMELRDYVLPYFILYYALLQGSRAAPGDPSKLRPFCHPYSVSHQYLLSHATKS